MFHYKIAKTFFQVLIISTHYLDHKVYVISYTKRGKKMAVHLNGIQTQAPQLKKATAQPQLTFQGMQKADTVSFGNANALVKVAKEAPKTGIFKSILNFCTKYAGKALKALKTCGEFLLNMLKKLNPMKLFKGKGAQQAAEKAQQMLKL